MDNKTETTDTTQQSEQTDAEKAATAQREEREAEDAFAAGFKKVAHKEEAAAEDPNKKSDTTDTTDTTGEATAQAAATTAGEKKDDAAAAAAAAAEAEDPWKDVHPMVRKTLESLTNQVGEAVTIAKTTQGRVGSMQSALDRAKQAAEKAGSDKPSDQQIAAAMADPEAWKKFEEDFPDFAKPVKAQFEALHAELAKVKPQTVDVDAIKKDVTQTVRSEIVEDAHPKWQETVKTQEFATWLNGQAADVKALAASARPRDAIKLLDSYKTHAEQAAKATQTTQASASQKKQQRLEAAVNPKGTSAAPDAGISDEEAFNRGFKKVARTKAA